jgi:predicted nucleic acid-binding protein
VQRGSALKGRNVLLPDANILVDAHGLEAPEHDRYAEWLKALASGPAPFGLSELGASGFVRIVTNLEIWDEPTSTETALEFVERLRLRSNARLLTHGPQSWAHLPASARRRALAASSSRTRITRPSPSSTAAN